MSLPRASIFHVPERTADIAHAAFPTGNRYMQMRDTLGTVVSPETGTDTEILQAYQEQHTTVEPGLRWIKNPAAISPVWREKPERIAALAMLTVVGLLVYSIIQRRVCLRPWQPMI